MKNKKTFIIVACIIAVIAVVIGIAASQGTKNKAFDDTSSTTTITTAVEETTVPTTAVDEAVNATTEHNANKAENTTAHKDKKATKTRKAKKEDTTETTSRIDENNFAITIKDAKAVLEEFYGTTYTVTTTDFKDNKQTYEIKDKKGGKYATVEVDLTNGNATETIYGSSEDNSYNLLV